jgi:hypothetical protein
MSVEKPSSDPASFDTAVEKLASAQEQMETMSRTMGGLQTTVAELSRKLYQSQLVGAIVIAGFVLDLLLTGGLTWVAFQQQSTTSAVQQVQDRTSQQVLCPLFRLLLGFQRPAARAVYPQGPAAYDAVLQQMHSSFQNLNCH